MRKSFLLVAIAVALLVATAVPGVAKPGNGAEVVHFDELRCGVEWYPVQDFDDTILDPACKVHNVRSGNGAYHLVLHGQIPDEDMDDFIADGTPRKAPEGQCLANYGFIVDEFGDEPSGWPADWRDEAVFTTSVRQYTPDGKMTEVCHAKPAKPAKRVDVCHYDADTDLYKLLNIKAKALDEHLAHGDGEPELWYDGGPTGIYGFTEDCWRIDLNSDLGGEMTPEKVLANGGDYQNDVVQNAIDQGYAGLVEITRYTHPPQVVFDFDFWNLAADTTYTVYLDNNGGTPEPFELLGTFTTDDSGEGTFGTYAPDLDAGYYEWAFWVTEEPSGVSVLQTVNDHKFDAY